MTWTALGKRGMFREELGNTSMSKGYTGKYENVRVDTGEYGDVEGDIGKHLYHQQQSSFSYSDPTNKNKILEQFWSVQF